MKKTLKIILVIIVIFLIVAGASYIVFKNINDMDKENTRIAEESSKPKELEKINIIKRGEAKSYDLQGIYYETDLMLTDMTLDQVNYLYYKILDNAEDYEVYRERIPEFPDASEINFDKNFIIIVASEKPRKENEKDMAIYEINSDDTTTYVKLKQREEPDYNNNYNNWYAVAKKSLLRENINININKK